MWLRINAKAELGRARKPVKEGINDNTKSGATTDRCLQAQSPGPVLAARHLQSTNPSEPTGNRPGETDMVALLGGALPAVW
jgi:hypothetical protein